jgi:basic membrane protein A
MFKVGARTAVALAVVSALAVAGAATARPHKTHAQFKLGVVLPTSSHDLNWSQTMTSAVKQVAKQMNVKLSLTDNVFDPTKAKPIFEQLVAQKYDLILAHSFSYGQLISELAPKYPSTPFVVAGANITPHQNYAVVTYSYHETGYTQCWLAAKLSKSGTIGNVGVMKVPFNLETNEGCRLGAKAANPKVKVLEAYTNDFVDQQKGREVGQSLLDKGADVLFVSGGSDSSLGALALCGSAKVPCTSTNYDNRSVAPAAVVSSAVIDWRPFLRTVIGNTMKHQFKPFLYDATYENGGMSNTPFNGPSAKLVPASVRSEFAQMTAQLKAGKIKLPKSKIHPCCV